MTRKTSLTCLAHSSDPAKPRALLYPALAAVNVSKLQLHLSEYIPAQWRAAQPATQQQYANVTQSSANKFSSCVNTKMKSNSQTNTSLFIILQNTTKYARLLLAADFLGCPSTSSAFIAHSSTARHSRRCHLWLFSRHQAADTAHCRSE